MFYSTRTVYLAWVISWVTNILWRQNASTQRWCVPGMGLSRVVTHPISDNKIRILFRVFFSTDFAFWDCLFYSLFVPLARGVQELSNGVLINGVTRKMVHLRAIMHARWSPNTPTKFVNLLSDQLLDLLLSVISRQHYGKRSRTYQRHLPKTEKLQHSNWFAEHWGGLSEGVGSNSFLRKVSTGSLQLSFSHFAFSASGKVNSIK